MKLKVLGILGVLMLLLVGCGTTKEVAKDKKKIGIVLSIGGLGDKSFNDSAYKGLMEIDKKYDIEVKYLEPATLSDEGVFIEEFVAQGYDFVIGTGFTQADAIAKAARENPTINFAIIDTFVDEENVASLIFDEKQGSYLAGALAAIESKNGKVGFVGGMELPLIKRFEAGYREGAMAINPDIEVFSAYTSGSNPFNDPVQGKENALSMIGQGADVLYHASGGTGVGVLQGAQEAGVKAIGVDADQKSVAPDAVMSSMLKKVDVAVFTLLDGYMNDDFKSGKNVFNLENGGVGLTSLNDALVGEETNARIEGIRADLIKEI